MINEGYKIIGYSTVIKKDMVIAVGYNPNAVDPFVVWNYNKNSDTYSRGIYCSSLYSATKIMAEKFHFYCCCYGLDSNDLIGDESSPKQSISNELGL